MSQNNDNFANQSICPNESILFVTNSAQYAPYWHRIEGLSHEGVSGPVLAFERDVDLTRTPVGDAYESLGKLNSGAYHMRLLPALRALKRIRQASRNRKWVYCYGLDMALISIMATAGLPNRPRFAMEIHDIRGIETDSGLLSTIMRSLSRFAQRRIHLLIVTSKTYVTEYYSKVLQVKPKQVIEIENKVDDRRIGNVRSTAKISNQLIRIGWFGSLRCEHAWRAMELLTATHEERFEIYARGILPKKEFWHHEVLQSPFVKFDGPYDNPMDLRQIYSQVHLVWAAGFNSKLSYRWARTCRFYQACYFEKPLIVQAGTVEADVTAELGIGIVVDIENAGELCDKISSLSWSDINSMVKNIRRLPRNMYTISNEYSRLRELLTNLGS